MQEQRRDIVKLDAWTQKRHIPLTHKLRPGPLAEDRQGVDTWLCELLLGGDFPSFTSRATSKDYAKRQAATEAVTFLVETGKWDEPVGVGGAVTGQVASGGGAGGVVLLLVAGGSVVSGQAHCRMGWWQRPALTCYQKDAKWVGGQNFRVFLIVAYFTYTITLHFLYFIEVNSNDSLQTTELNTLMWYKASKTSHILYFIFQQ